MGIFVNPNNSAFQVALNSEIYVDKTRLLSYTNKVLGTKEGFICNSRPRRFGKSTTADMLAAYYSRGCDSKKMFEGLEISLDSNFYTHLNRYEEIRSEFSKATRRKKWNELTELYVRSNELLQSTLDMDSNAVAELIERFHMDYTSALQYNNENSLSSVLSIAYLSAMQYYFKPVREMPAGRGFADLVFLPKKEYPELPALLMELKWNKSAEGAIRQVKERKYVKTLENYTGEILLIGINYSKKEKRHQCVIEKR